MNTTPGIVLNKRARKVTRAVLLLAAAMALTWLVWVGWRAVAAGLDTGWTTPVVLEGISARPWLALIILASLASLGGRYGFREWRRVSNTAGILRVEATAKGIDLVGAEGTVSVKRGQTVKLHLGAPVKSLWRASDTVKVTSGSTTVTYELGTVARSVTAAPLVAAAAEAGVTVKSDGVSTDSEVA